MTRPSQGISFFFSHITSMSSSRPKELHFHSNGGTYPPHGLITANDHGPYVVVTTWIMMCLMSLALIARLATRWNLAIDNLIITVAGVSFCLRCSTSLLTIPFLGTEYHSECNSSYSCQPWSWKTQIGYEQLSISAIWQGM